MTVAREGHSLGAGGSGRQGYSLGDGFSPARGGLRDSHWCLHDSRSRPIRAQRCAGSGPSEILDASDRLGGFRRASCGVRGVGGVRGHPSSIRVGSRLSTTLNRIELNDAPEWSPSEVLLRDGCGMSRQRCPVIDRLGGRRQAGYPEASGSAQPSRARCQAVHGKLAGGFGDFSSADVVQQPRGSVRGSPHVLRNRQSLFGHAPSRDVFLRLNGLEARTGCPGAPFTTGVEGA